MIDREKYPGLDPSVIGVFDTYELRIANHERTINALRKRNAELEADCDIKAHHYKMQALLAEELQKQLDRALERIAKLESSYRDKEPCGHPKNFLIGDEWGHFTCTICKADRALSELAEARKALELIASHSGRCLLGNTAQGDDMCQAYQSGSNAAFEELAGIARAAIPAEERPPEAKP